MKFTREHLKDLVIAAVVFILSAPFIGTLFWPYHVRPKRGGKMATVMDGWTFIFEEAERLLPSAYIVCLFLVVFLLVLATTVVPIELWCEPEARFRSPGLLLTAFLLTEVFALIYLNYWGFIVPQYRPIATWQGLLALTLIVYLAVINSLSFLLVSDTLPLDLHSLGLLPRRLRSVVGSFASFLMALIFFLCHQLIDAFKALWFFCNRYVYSAPSYTGHLKLYLPRVYNWLVRLPWRRRFSQKQRAFSSRRSYLIFVWFSFSYFLRGLFLIPMLLGAHFYGKLCSIANGLFALPLGSLYFLLYRILYSAPWAILRRFNNLLGIFLYDSYLKIRRYLYYMNANEYTSYWASLFVEKATKQREKLAIFDTYIGEWNLSSAAPNEMPPMRPSFFSFISRWVSPVSSLAWAHLPGFLLYSLSGFLGLIFKALFLVLWWPLLMIIESVLLALMDFPSTFAWRTAFLTNLAHMAKIVAGQWSALATLVLLPFFMVGNLILLAWPPLSLTAVRLLTYSLYVTYVGLWIVLQLLAYLPMVVLYVLTRPLVFFFQRFNFFLWLFLLFAFGGYIFLCVAHILGELLPALPSLFRLSGAYLGAHPDRVYAGDWQSLSEYGLRSNWIGHMSTSFRHWWRKYYKYHSTINWDPFIFIGNLQYYWAAFERRGGESMTYYQRKVLGFYAQHLYFPFFGNYRLSSLLARLVQPSFPLHRWGEARSYVIAYRLTNYSFRLLVYPAIFLSFQTLLIQEFIERWLAYLRSYYILKLLINFYILYYQLLGSMALALYFFALEMLETSWRFLKTQGASFSDYALPLIIQAKVLVAQELYRIFVQYLAIAHSYLQQRLLLGNLWYWYGELLLSCWERQWSFYSPLLALQHFPEKIITYVPSAIGASFTDMALRLCHTLVPLGSLQWSGICSVDFFHLYLYCVVRFLQFWDTLGIYWQLAKLPWHSFADWEHYRHIRKHKRNLLLRHTHLSRKSWFSNLFVHDIWLTFKHICSDRRFIQSYGSELRKHYNRWALMVDIVKGKYVFLLLTLYDRSGGDLFQPHYTPPHTGYLYYSMAESHRSVYQLGSSAMRFLVQLRRWSSSLEGPFFYYAGLLFLVVFSSSFRGLFFPRLYEGSAAAHWTSFVENKDPKLALSLMLPPLPSYQPEWYQPSFASQSLGPAALYLRQVQSQSAGEHSDGLDAVLSFTDYRNLLYSMKNQASKALKDRREGLRLTRQEFWKRSSLAERSLNLSPRARHLQSRWNAKLWSLQPRTAAGFRSSSYSYFFYDFKIQAAYGHLQKLYFALPQKTINFFASFRDSGQSELQATYACANFDEREEIRAEYLYRSDKLHRRLLSLLSLRLTMEQMDRVYFKNSLGKLFYHKDGNILSWISEEMSQLMSTPELRLKFTPLIFSKYIHAQRYVMSYPEEVSCYPFLCFWFIAFPLVIIAEAFLRHYNLEGAWSPRKGRYNHSEAWGLWVHVFLHFDVLVDICDYLWAWGSTTLHLVRAGSRGAMDEPGKWWRKSNVTGTLYFWDWITHWRYASFSYRSYYSPRLFRSTNLEELRLFYVSILMVYLFLMAVCFYKHDFAVSRKKPSFYLLMGWPQFPSLSALFAQRDFYQRSKKQLRRGLLHIWLSK